MALDFSRCREVPLADGTMSPPPLHVKIGVEHIIANPYFLLADDMGGMKTAQTIISAQFLSEMGKINQVIVVAPASVRPVWFDQDLGQLAEQLWFGKRSHIVEYHQRNRVWIHEPSGTNEMKWIITNYEYIRRKANLAPLLQVATDKTLLVLDESSAVKGYDSNQTEACMILRKKCGRVLLLNGTPLADSPMDLFSQGNIMHPSILQCPYVTHYRNRYAVMENVLRAGGEVMLDKFNRPIQTIAKWRNLEDLQKRFAPYVLRREAKALGIDFALPPVPLEVRLTEATWKIYKSMRDEMVAWLENGDVAVAQQAPVKAMRLSQITSGFVGGIEDSGLEEDLRTVEPVQEVGREKLDFALKWHAELLERFPDLKLLTWCRFVPELERYLKEMAKFNHPLGAVCGKPMFGGSKKEEREQALRLLHPKTAPEGPATVGGTYGTGALGLNFTACRTVLDMSFDFSPWKKKQGDARVNRPGQTGPVSFFYLIAVGPKGQKTIDHHVIMHRLEKTNLNEWTAKAWVKALLEE